MRFPGADFVLITNYSELYKKDHLGLYTSQIFLPSLHLPAMDFSMLSSDHFGFVCDQYENPSSDFLPLSSSTFDLHHLHESVLVSPHLTNPPFQWYENNSFRSSFNGLNHVDSTLVSHQLMVADHNHNELQWQQNLHHFSTALQRPPATLPQGQFGASFGSQFGVIVRRSVVEMITYQQIQSLPHVTAPSPYYQAHSQTPPKNYMLMEVEDDDDYDIKPNLLHFPALPQNNSVCLPQVLQIEGQNQMPEDDDPNDNDGHKNQTDKHGTRSLKHKKYGPYTCPRCKMEIETSQSFASHMKSHYSSETEDERKKRIEAKYKKKNLRVAYSYDGQLTLVPEE